jgi:hypothetical protein
MNRTAAGPEGEFSFGGDRISHSEIFSPGKIVGITGTYLAKGRGQPEFIHRLSAERNRDPIKFLYKIALDLQGKKVVCFKLKHDELSLPEYLLRTAVFCCQIIRIVYPLIKFSLQLFSDWRRGFAGLRRTLKFIAQLFGAFGDRWIGSRIIGYNEC